MTATAFILDIACAALFLVPLNDAALPSSALLWVREIGPIVLAIATLIVALKTKNSAEKTEKGVEVVHSTINSKLDQWRKETEERRRESERAAFAKGVASERADATVREAARKESFRAGEQSQADWMSATQHHEEKPDPKAKP